MRGVHIPEIELADVEVIRDPLSKLTCPSLFCMMT